MSTMKFADLFFQKKYLDWKEYRMKIDQFEEEYYEIWGEERSICG